MSNTPKVRFAGFSKSWDERKLGDIAEIIGGGTPSTSNPEYWDGDIDWYAPAEMDGKRYATGSARKITELGLQKSSAKILPAERTVLFTSRAGIGKMAILKHPGATNQGFQSLVMSDSYNPYFIYSMEEEIKAKAEGVASGSTFLEISGKMLGNIKIFVPSKQEQDAVSECFERVDNFISLHQCEYEKLVALKAACLDKMFPKKGNKVPQMRFAGFAKDWEQSKFKDSFEFLTNNTLSRAELDERSGSIYNLHYGDILVKFGETLNLERDVLPYISDKTNVPKTDFLQNGDVIITDTAEDDAVGKCTEIVGASDSKIVSGLHTIPCRPYKEFAKGYLGYFMNSPVYHDQLVPLMQGTKVTSISKSALQGTMIYYPSDIKEQTLIGEFFMGLNNLITLQQKKVKKLKQIKQALLHNMFV